MAKRRIQCDLAFHEAIAAWLQDASLSRCADSFDYKLIRGTVVQSSYRAEIEIAFCPDSLKKKAPIVFCDEPWIRRELDWHCFRAKGANEAWADRDRLCWIHPCEWELANDHQSKKLRLVIDEGSEWLKNNLLKLLDRHWTGHELGIKKWKTEWGGWGHGKTGTNQLLAELRKNGHPNNWQKVVTEQI